MRGTTTQTHLNPTLRWPKQDSLSKDTCLAVPTMLARPRWLATSYVIGEEETIEHFLHTCPVLASKRVKELQKIYWLLVSNHVPMPNDA